MTSFGTVFTLCADHIDDDPMTSFGTVFTLCTDHIGFGKSS